MYSEKFFITNLESPLVTSVEQMFAMTYKNNRVYIYGSHSSSFNEFYVKKYGVVDSFNEWLNDNNIKLDTDIVINLGYEEYDELEFADPDPYIIIEIFDPIHIALYKLTYC